MKNILILGDPNFISRHLITAANEAGYNATMLDLGNEEASDNADLALPPH